MAKLNQESELLIDENQFLGEMIDKLNDSLLVK